MNGYLKSILGATLVVASTAGPLWADDVKFMDGVTPRAGDNPQTEAGKFKRLRLGHRHERFWRQRQYLDGPGRP